MRPLAASGAPGWLPPAPAPPWPAPSCCGSELTPLPCVWPRRRAPQHAVHGQQTRGREAGHRLPRQGTRAVHAVLHAHGLLCLRPDLRACLGAPLAGRAGTARAWMRRDNKPAAALAHSRLTAPQVYLEDAGFDWKILGPDVHDFDYVAWQVSAGRAGAACEAHAQHWQAALPSQVPAALQAALPASPTPCPSAPLPCERAVRPGRLRLQRPEVQRAEHPVHAPQLGRGGWVREGRLPNRAGRLCRQSRSGGAGPVPHKPRASARARARADALRRAGEGAGAARRLAPAGRPHHRPGADLDHRGHPGACGAPAADPGCVGGCRCLPHAVVCVRGRAGGRAGAAACGPCCC